MLNSGLPMSLIIFTLLAEWLMTATSVEMKGKEILLKKIYNDSYKSRRFTISNEEPIFIYMKFFYILCIVCMPVFR
jgi:hypothetical protein